MRKIYQWIRRVTIVTLYDMKGTQASMKQEKMIKSNHSNNYSVTKNVMVLKVKKDDSL